MKKKNKKLKSLYLPNGLQYNKEGLLLSKEIRAIIETKYKKYLKKGYKPFEIREIMVSEIIHISTLQNVLHF